MLCDLCREIDLKPWQQLTREEKITLLTYADEWPPEQYDEGEILEDGILEDEALNDDSLVGFPGELFYLHHRTLKSLQKAADDGCHFCYQMLYGVFENALHDSDLENIPEELYLMYLCLLPARNPAIENELNYNGALTVNLGGKYWGHLRLRDKSGRHTLRGFLHLKPMYLQFISLGRRRPFCSPNPGHREQFNHWICNKS
jgi:hypothetical protein